jgi:hypothetical protein
MYCELLDSLATKHFPLVDVISKNKLCADTVADVAVQDPEEYERIVTDLLVPFAHAPLKDATCCEIFFGTEIPSVWSTGSLLADPPSEVIACTFETVVCNSSANSDDTRNESAISKSH